MRYDWEFQASIFCDPQTLAVVYLGMVIPSNILKPKESTQRDQSFERCINCRGDYPTDLRNLNTYLWLS